MVQSGESEALKATVHGTLLALAAVCAVYNGLAWRVRRERHLARNAAFYGALVGYELVKVRHHLKGRV